VFQNRLLRIFGLKRDKVIGGTRTLNNEELHNLYSSLSAIRMIESKRMRQAEHVARMRAERIQDIGGKARRNDTPLGRPRHRWMDNIKMDRI
jgi:hypothetical protein